MAQISGSAVERAADLLADRLIEVYQIEQVVVMVDEFARAGFTRDSLIEDPDALYRMMVIAAYDRWPFTQGTGGYENIWELHPDSVGVPTLLARAGLWSMAALMSVSDSEIQVRLSRLYLGGHTMASDGGSTFYYKTLRTVSRYAGGGFVNRLQQTRSSTQIRAVFQTFVDIHGIGPTIASKLVKYLLREIRIGKAQPADFPRDVAWPIIKEWHAGRAAEKFRRLNPDLVPRTAIMLEQRGDAYAIDALFYLQRNRPWELDGLIKDLETI